MKIEIPQDAELLIRSKAQAAGMAVGEYVLHLVRRAEHERPPNEEVLAELPGEELASGMATHTRSDLDSQSQQKQLTKLLQQVNDANLHSEQDWGKREGKEAW